MKITPLAFFLFSFPLIAEEAKVLIQPQPAYLQPLAGKSLLTDVGLIGVKGYVAVGERGHILISQDQQNWQQAAVPVQSNLNSVFFLNQQQGWAVGHDATILATNDGGQHWTLQQFLPEKDKPLFDIYFRNAEDGIAVGAYGMVFRTADGGNSWQAEFHTELLTEDDQELLAELQETDPEAYQIEQQSILPHFNRLYAQDNMLYLVGEAGFVAISDDFGKQWQLLEEFYNGSLFDINLTPKGHLLVVGLRGHAFRSEDQGDSWQQVMLDTQATLNSVFTDEHGRVFITGNAGTVLVSSDDGQSFTDISEDDGKAIMNGIPAGNTAQGNRSQAEALLLVTEVGIKLKAIEKSE